MTHGTKQWDNAKAQLKRRAAAVQGRANTPREHALLSLIARNADAIMARPADFLEANTMLHSMEARTPAKLAPSTTPRAAGEGK